MYSYQEDMARWKKEQEKEQKLKARSNAFAASYDKIRKQQEEAERIVAATKARNDECWPKVIEHVRAKKCDDQGRKYVCARDVGRVTGLEGQDLKNFMDWMIRTARISHASGRWYAVTTLEAIPAQAVQGVNDYVRQKLREDSFARKIFGVDPHMLNGPGSVQPSIPAAQHEAQQALQTIRAQQQKLQDQADAIMGAYAHSMMMQTNARIVVDLAAQGAISQQTAMRQFGIDPGAEYERMRQERDQQRLMPPRFA